MFLLQKNGEFKYISSKINSNKYITPLMTDTHMHILGLGEKLSNPSFDGKSLEEIKEILINKLKENPDKIILRGWSEEFATPSKTFLDNISKEIPIFLVRRCGHVGIVNTKMFETIDFNDYNDYVDYNTGRITEQALEIIYEELGYFNDVKKAFETSKEYLLKKGYGFVHSDDIHGITKSEIPFYNDDFKVYEKVAINNYKMLEDFFLKGYFKVFDSVKIYTDGSFGGRTAYMKENYSDSDTKGFFVWDLDELQKSIEFCEKHELHLALHAIGDGAVDNILNIFDKVNPKINHRIIHSAVLHDYQLEKIKKHDIILDMQPPFIKSDESILESRLGYRLPLAYRFKDIYDRNIKLFLSSDAPIEIPDWYRDVKTLKNLDIPLKFIINNMTYFPEFIDGFNREEDMQKRHLIFDINPFEKLSLPKIIIN